MQLIATMILYNTCGLSAQDMAEIFTGVEQRRIRQLLDRSTADILGRKTTKGQMDQS